MATVRHSTTWVARDGQRHELGAYKHEAQAGLATDLANLLQAHILARSGGGAAPQPELSVLPAASVEDLAEREEWAELCGAPSLEQAIRLLADSRLAEQLYYDLFSVETSDDTSMEAEQGSVSAQQQQSQQQHSQQQQQPQQQQQQHSQQPQQQQQQINGLRQSEAGLDGLAKDACLAGQEASLMGSQVASIESIEDGELVGARLPSGLLREPPAPGAQPLKQEPAEGQSGPAADGPPTAVPTPAVPLAEAGAATEDVGMEAESGFEAEDAAAALQHLAALPSAAWQDGASAGEDSEGDGGWVPGRKRRAGRAPSRGPPERRPRKQRPAKLWCRYPLDDERWALILSQSAISSRQISLPWTQPGDMACELLGAGWVEAVRRRTQSGTVRETAALVLDGDDGERQVSYALYQNTGASQKETRPQYLEKLHPVLQSRSASVGDVLLLRPAGPGRLHAQLVKSDSEEAQAVHASLGFDVPSEQQAWQSKHPSRQPSRASSQNDLSQLEASPGTAAAAAAAAGVAAGAAEAPLAGTALSPPAATAAEGRQQSPAPHLAAPRQEHVSPAAKAATASAYVKAVEQAAAADALEEMMPHHKRPKWEHPSDHGPPSLPAAAAPAPGQEVHRKPSGLSALLQHPPPAAHPPLPPAQQEQLRRAAMQQQIAMVSAAQRQAHAQNKPGGVQRPPAAAGVVDTMAMGRTQLAMLQQYRTRLKEGSKEYEECSAHIAALQQSMQHLSRFAKPAAAGAAAAPQPAARPAAAAPPAASTPLQQQMQQKPPAPRPLPLPQRPPVVPMLPKQAVPLPARPPGQPAPAMRQVQIIVGGRPMSVLVQAGMEGRVMQDMMARMSTMMAGQPQQAAAMAAAMAQQAAAAAAAARPAQPAAAAPPAGPPGKPATAGPAAPVPAAPAVPSQTPAGGSVTASAQPAAQPVRPSSPGAPQPPQSQPTVSTPPPKPAAAPPVPALGVPSAVQLARPPGASPVILMSRPLLIRSTTVPHAAPAVPSKPAQQAQQPASGAAATAAAGSSGPAPAQAAAKEKPPAAGSAPGSAAAQRPAQPAPDASVSLAHMQAALQAFAAGVAVRVPPGEEHRQHVNERLHALASELDALLKGFWQQQGPK